MDIGSFFIEGKKSEIWCFLAALIAPHNIVAMALVIWVMTGLSMSSRGNKHAIWIAPPVALVLTTFHPYDLPTIYVVGSIFLVLLRLRDGKINRPLLFTYLGVIVLTLPVIAYHYWALSTAPDLRGLFLQNNIAPYSSLKYVIGLLPIGLLAFRQMVLWLANYKTVSNPQLLIVSWAVTLPVLLYSYPDIGIAWKLTIAMPFPLSVLAVEWITQRTKSIQESFGSNRTPLWRISPAVTGVVIVSLLSSAFIVLTMVNTAREQSSPFYTSRANYDALRWIAAQPGTDDVVISLQSIGVLVPRLAHKRSFMGHDHQSVDYTGKMSFAGSLFLDGKLSDDELQLLRSYRVKWLIYGKEERELWPNLRSSENLLLVYNQADIQVYKIDYNGSTVN